MTNSYKTFHQWSALGYKVKKGSKATWITDVPMFSKEQVEYSPRRRSYSNIGLGDHKGFDNPHYDYRYGDVDYDDPINFDRWM